MSSSGNSSNTNGTDGGNNKNDVMALQLTDQLKDEGIITKYVVSLKTCHFILELNSIYDQKKIISTIVRDWPKTVETFKKEMKRRGVKPNHISMICEVADNNADVILGRLMDEREEQQQAGTDRSAQKILALIELKCEEVFLDQFGTPMAAVRIRDHLEVIKISHKYGRFRNLIFKLYRESTGGNMPGSESLTNAICALEADADFHGKTSELHLRCAYDPAEKNVLWYDLTNSEWKAVKITPEGWSIEKSPILFRRYRNNLAQVYPGKDYDKGIFDKFMKLLNIKHEDHKLLLKCYIIALFLPEFPQAVLMLHGDPGAAKTTLEELIKILVDPSNVLTLTLPKDQNELIQQLAQRRIAYYDNVSSIPEWVSDVLCRATTGSGSSKRVLFTDEDELIYNFMRCIGFNGINLAATKADLLERGLIIEVEKIQNVRKIEEIKKEFEELRPQLLTYIFDVLVKFLHMKQTTSIEMKQLPRMADFAENCEILSRCMGNPDGKFIKAYSENIKLQTEIALESSFLASVVVKFMEDKLEWKGTGSDLLIEVDKVAEGLKPGITRDRSWVKRPHVLSRKLNDIKMTLGQIGIFIKRGRDETGTKRYLEIIKSENRDSKTETGEGTTGQKEEEWRIGGIQRQNNKDYTTENKEEGDPTQDGPDNDFGSQEPQGTMEIPSEACVASDGHKSRLDDIQTSYGILDHIPKASDVTSGKKSEDRAQNGRPGATYVSDAISLNTSSGGLKCYYCDRVDFTSDEELIVHMDSEAAVANEQRNDLVLTQDRNTFTQANDPFKHPNVPLSSKPPPRPEMTDEHGTSK